MSDVQNISKFFDIDFQGVDSNSNLLSTINKDSLVNALTLWLASFTGERIHGVFKGGYVTRHLAKPMNEDTKDLIEFSIRDGLTNNFFPRVVINSISVVPVYERRYWDINVEVYSPDLKSDISTNVKLKGLT